LAEELSNYVDFRSCGKEQVRELHGHFIILLAKFNIPGGNIKVVF